MAREEGVGLWEGTQGRLACQCCQPGWAALTLVIRFEMEQRDSRSEFSLSRSFSSLSLFSLSLSLLFSRSPLSLLFSCSLSLSVLPPSLWLCLRHACSPFLILPLSIWESKGQGV